MPARLSAMCISISAEELQTQPSLVPSALLSPRRFRLRRNRSCPVRHFHHLQRGFLIAPSGHHARRTANDLFGKVWSLENTVNSAPCEQLGNSFKLMKISPWGCKKSPVSYLCSDLASSWWQEAFAVVKASACVQLSWGHPLWCWAATWIFSFGYPSVNGVWDFLLCRDGLNLIKLMTSSASRVIIAERHTYKYVNPEVKRISAVMSMFSSTALNQLCPQSIETASQGGWKSCLWHWCL